MDGTLAAAHAWRRRASRRNARCSPCSPPPPRACSYEGEWVQNKMHGKGKYTDTNGHTWHGQFYNGAGPGLTYILQ